MTGGKFTRRVSDAQSAHQSGQQGAPNGEAPPEGAPLGGTKSEAAQRLQVGLFGIGSMVLLVGLASILGNQADLAEERAVPNAAPTTEPTEASPQRDPLADAGIVPDIPSEPSPTPTDLPTDVSAGPLDGAEPVSDAPAPE